MKKTFMLVTNENVQTPGVVFGVSVDQDGDLLVKANGVKVFYVDCEKGSIRRFLVTDDQAQAGVLFTGNRVAVDDF